MAQVDTKLIPGPKSNKVSKEDAERQLRAHPQFPKSAHLALDEVEGRWVAAITTVAEFPPGEADDVSPEPSGPPSPDEGPSSELEDDAGEESEAPSEEKSEHKDKKDKDGKGGKEEEILHLLTTLLTALGISPDGAGDSPLPGLDEGPPGGPEGLPGGPEGGPPGPGGPEDSTTHTVHHRSLKPGEAPPGTTPIGSPAFASTKVAEDHPWSDAIGVKRTFPVEEAIGDASLADIKAELDSLAEGTGYEVKQLVEGRTQSGERTAKALISR